MKDLKFLNVIALIIFGALLISTTGCKRKGCTDPAALNYDSKAKKDDGSCVYDTPEIPDKGCTDSTAINYDPNAVDDDGSCVYANTTKLASDWVSNADWANATTVTLTFQETPTYGFEISQKTFTAGQPYILQIINPVGNSAKHYFATDGPTDFFTAIATRKVETEDAEYKAPFFEAIELLAPTTSDRMVEFYFVAVKTGKYHLICTISGHQGLGMEDSLEITGDNSLQLDLEVASDFNTELARDGRKSGSDPVWDPMNRIDTTVTMVESPPYSYSPSNWTMTKDVGYKLSLVNPASNSSKHYYTAPELYKTVVIRKCQDSHAEIKPFYLKAVELKLNSASGTQTDLYIVPTVAGSYPVFCTIGTHRSQGMDATITVQ